MRVGETDKNVEDIIKSRLIEKIDPRYPGNILQFLKKMPELKDTMTIN